MCGCIKLGKGILYGFTKSALRNNVGTRCTKPCSELLEYRGDSPFSLSQKIALSQCLVFELLAQLGLHIIDSPDDLDGFVRFALFPRYLIGFDKSPLDMRKAGDMRYPRAAAGFGVSRVSVWLRDHV